MKHMSLATSSNTGPYLIITPEEKLITEIPVEHEAYVPGDFVEYKAVLDHHSRRGKSETTNHYLDTNIKKQTKDDSKANMKTCEITHTSNVHEDPWKFGAIIFVFGFPKT